MSFTIKRIISVLTRPSIFFQEVKDEKGFRCVLGLLLSLGIFLAISGFGISYFAIWYLKIQGKLTEQLFFLPIRIFLGFIVNIVLISILLHLWLKLLGGKGTFDKTFQLYIYSSMPYYLFAGLSLILFFTIKAPLALILFPLLLWNLSLLYEGVRVFHEISRIRAFFVILPVLVLMVMAVWIILIIT